MRVFLVVAAVAASSVMAAGAAAQQAAAVNYHLVKKIPIDTEGAWDYLNIDQTARRLYVSHGNEVDVVDIDAEKVAGKIEGMNRTHGIAIAAKFGHGFITSGGNSTVRMFDLKTLATLADIPAPGSPDGVLYEPKTERVFAFDHRGGVVTVIDAKDGKVAGTIQIGGMPEFPATDGKGTVWVNQEDKSMLVKIDAAAMKVLSTTPDAPCEGPTGMDIDREHRLLFVGCGNEKMAVIHADTGAVMTTLPIGVHVDATWFDPERKLIFNANRSTVTIIKQEAKDKYAVVQTLATEGHANTLAVDFKTHRIFAATSMYTTEHGVTAAVIGAAPAKPVDKVVPGTATVLVYAP